MARPGCCTTARPWPQGPLAGRSLGELLPQYGAALAGPEVDMAAGWPLLAKLLDASAWLSVQVHPDDAWAQLLEDEPRGKTEAWYVVAAEPGARLVHGVRPAARVRSWRRPSVTGRWSRCCWTCR